MTGTSAPATSRELFDLVAAGVQSGLPVPERLCLFDFQHLQLMPYDGDTAAVDRWAEYLALPQPASHKHIHPAKDGKPPWRTYRSASAQVLPGWYADVSCTVDLTAEEIAALGEPVGEVGT